MINRRTTLRTITMTHQGRVVQVDAVPVRHPRDRPPRYRGHHGPPSRLQEGQCDEFEGDHGSLHICCRGPAGVIFCYRIVHIDPFGRSAP